MSENAENIFNCVYCNEEVKINDFFLETISNKKSIIVKCGKCSVLPYEKRPNLKQAEEIQRKMSMMW